MKSKLAAAVAGSVVCAVLMSGCTAPPHSTDDGVDLTEVEVREYEGEDLSSITHFRENSIHGPQSVDIDSYALTISGLVRDTREFTYDEVITDHENYRKVVTLYCVEGWDVTILWEGILLRDLIKEAGAEPEAHTVIFRAVDGYSTSLPLSYILDNEILLAHKMNGVVLPPERGFPFHLVAESKWGYKWIKWVREIELSDDEHFLGYWEQRGFSNSADRDDSFFA